MLEVHTSFSSASTRKASDQREFGEVVAIGMIGRLAIPYGACSSTPNFGIFRVNMNSSKLPSPPNF
jgi:hypothetical protein